MGAGFCSLYREIHYIKVCYIKVWVYIRDTSLAKPFSGLKCLKSLKMQLYNDTMKHVEVLSLKIRNDYPWPNFYLPPLCGEKIWQLHEVVNKNLCKNFYTTMQILYRHSPQQKCYSSTNILSSILPSNKLCSSTYKYRL